ncbi:DUF551 domain-containing protein [Escherichia coli]|nr:DUF551 domain-containing protein [Escherichia coli]EHN3569148.1 DUF551 domain-containing protein [Escherichia coli]EJI8875051.1 DUF551 domain-containing protein [Escherichia coli]HAY4476228.1 DUF551 domain-containing protein [Escherichia coli]
MAELTKEWLKQTIAEYEANRDELPFGLDTNSAIELQAFKLALASLEAKPIGAFHIAEQQVDGTSDYLKDGEWPIDNGIIEVYAAPPVPVVPAALPENDDEDGHDIDYLEPSEVYALGRTAGWNACRAAMLQAEPVSNSDELPLDYLQGHKDGLEWAAQQAEANHPQTGDWLYDDPIDLARAIRKGPDMPTVQGGNSPVTPDGWISCSERMPAQDDWILIYSKHGEYMAGQVQEEYVELSDGTLSWLGNALFWMPLPEPPQEAK